MSSPVRTCVGCRRSAGKRELLRLALDTEGASVVVDRHQRLPGRGAYVHPDSDCVAAALRRRAVPRALRAPGATTTVLSDLATAYARSAEIE